MESITLEAALVQAERDAAAVVRALTAALRDAKKAQAAAQQGHLRELRAASEGAVVLAEQAVTAAKDLKSGWTFDDTAHLAGGGYLAEVLAAARAAGVDAYESDERLLSYPVIVRVSASDSSVTIDKAKERRIRPSVLVRTLKALQDRPPKFRAEAFLESLAVAYDLTIAQRGGRPGNTAKLVDVYAVLTLMPGASREYSKQEFARDLYLLDQSGITTTRGGRTMSLPASALTRGGGTLSTVTRGGQTKVYAGVSFEDAAG